MAQYLTLDKDGNEVWTDFNNKYINVIRNGERGIENNDPSVTVPGQSYTIAELIEKHRIGISPEVSKPVTYMENPTFDDVDPTADPDFDLADVTTLKSEIDLKVEKAKTKKKVEPKEPINDSVAEVKKAEKGETKKEV